MAKQESGSDFKVREKVGSYFKYLPPRRIDVISNGKICYSRAIDLNDPFELLPSVIPPITLEAFLEQRDQVAEMASLTQPPSERGPFLRRTHELAKADYAKEYSEEILHYYRHSVRRLSDDISAMLCLSKINNSILMWSHYAEDHKGFVIEFDATHPYFKKGIVDIKYSDVRPVILAQGGKQPIDILFTKCNDWSYEREVRQIAHIDIDKDNILQLADGSIFLKVVPGDKKVPRPWLRPYPPDMVKSIILGWHASDELELSMKSALKERGIECPISRAYPDDVHYSLKFRKV